MVAITLTTVAVTLVVAVVAILAVAALGVAVGVLVRRRDRTRPVVTEEAARRFLHLRRIAVVGVSPDPKQFGHVVFRALADHGIDVVPVHPTADRIDGHRVRHSLADLALEDPPVEGAVVMVSSDAAVAAVHEAADAGIRHVWLFRGAGSPGALSDESLAACRAHDLDVVAGACPLMFLDPVGAVHAVHRVVRRADGSLVGGGDRHREGVW
jgi:predicted CoA-binding protein